jgi:hypothetical protein
MPLSFSTSGRCDAGGVGYLLRMEAVADTGIEESAFGVGREELVRKQKTIKLF